MPPVATGLIVERTQHGLEWVISLLKMTDDVGKLELADDSTNNSHKIAMIFSSV